MSMGGVTKFEAKQIRADRLGTNGKLYRAGYLAAGPLYIGFAMTGIGVALPGALLPILLKRWSLEDEQGGVLFLLAWLGSSLGALLVRGSLRNVLVLGSACISVGACGLATTGGHTANLWIALFGLGLGVTMTSISLLRQQQTNGESREMVRLNLVWAIGACLCPTLTIRALASGRIGIVLFGLASSFGVLALWAIFQPGLWTIAATSKAELPWNLFRAVPWRLIVMTFLITGVEASTGGWLATYVHHGVHQLAQAIAAPTFLWAALLLSRLFWSVRLPASTEGSIRVARGSLVLMIAAATLLIADTRPAATLLAALCLGIAIGPLYPLFLAWALRFQRGGAIFFVAGVGSACLPWLTGLVSTLRGSLRTGLAVPIVASSVMLFLSLTPQMAGWTRSGCARPSIEV